MAQPAAPPRLPAPLSIVATSPSSAAAAPASAASQAQTPMRPFSAFMDSLLQRDTRQRLSLMAAHSLAEPGPHPPQPATAASAGRALSVSVDESPLPTCSPLMFEDEDVVIHELQSRRRRRKSGHARSLAVYSDAAFADILEASTLHAHQDSQGQDRGTAGAATRVDASRLAATREEENESEANLSQQTLQPSAEYYDEIAGTEDDELETGAEQDAGYMHTGGDTENSEGGTKGRPTAETAQLLPPTSASADSDSDHDYDNVNAESDTDYYDTANGTRRMSVLLARRPSLDSDDSTTTDDSPERPAPSRREAPGAAQAKRRLLEAPTSKADHKASNNKPAPLQSRASSARLNHLKHGSARHSPRQRKAAKAAAGGKIPARGKTASSSSSTASTAQLTMVPSEEGGQPTTAVVTEDGATQMIFDVSGNIPVVLAGGTVALVEHLLGYTLQPQAHKSGWNPFQISTQLKKEKLAVQEEYLETFTLSFRAFVSPDSLLHILLNQLSKADDDTALCRHVLMAAASWVELGWPDFRADPALMASLSQLLRLAEARGDMKDYVQALQGAVTAQVERDGRRRRRLQALANEPSTSVSVVVIDAQHLAEQLTIYNWQLFRNVHPAELMSHVLTGAVAPSLASLMSRFDQEYYWAEGLISESSDPKLQAVMLDKMIHVVAHCRNLNNFFTMFTILGALDTPKTRKLNEAWSVVPKESRKLLSKLQTILATEKNMKAYRQMYRRCAPKTARLPFLPVVTKDLRFVADGNQGKVEGLHNFERLRMLAAIVMEVHNHVRWGYKRLAEDLHLQQYFYHVGQSIDQRMGQTQNAQQLLIDKVKDLERRLAERESHIVRLQSRNQELETALVAADEQKQVASDATSQLKNKVQQLEAELNTVSELRDTAVAEAWALRSPPQAAAKSSRSEATSGSISAFERLRQLERLQTAVASTFVRTGLAWGGEASEVDLGPEQASDKGKAVLAAMCERVAVLERENQALWRRLVASAGDEDGSARADLEASLRQELAEEAAAERAHQGEEAALEVPRAGGKSYPSKSTARPGAETAV